MLKNLDDLLKDFSMTMPETLEEFYARHPYLKTSDLLDEKEHFNVMPIGKRNLSENPDVVAFGRKNYFKICLVSGQSKIHYADKSFEIKEHGLLFANPFIPYNWETLSDQQTGYSCIFTESYTEGSGNIKKYPFFQLEGYPVFELNKDEKVLLEGIFLQMQQELSSDFSFKHDVLKNLIFQLIFTALKLRPSTHILAEKANAPGRIASLFMELLEKQFPIRNTIEGIRLRSASDFADQMSVHVNHLNKSVKETLFKTTSQLISERILKESKIMLRHSSWSISEIAYSLGFEGPSHFSSFFKKQMHLSPTQFRAKNSMSAY